MAVLLLAYAEWKSALEALVPALRAVGGLGVLISDAMQFNYLPLIILAASVVYLAFVADTEPGSARAVWLPIVGWTACIALYVLMSASFLFAAFVETSRIPELVQMLERQTTERGMNDEQRKAAYDDLRKSIKDITDVRVWTVRDPEANQLATEILSLFNAAALKVRYDGRRQTEPEIVDARTPRNRGIKIYAKDSPEARNAGIIIGNALLKAGLTVELSSLLDEDDEYSVLVYVAYR